MKIDLPWHHVHITLIDREAAAIWHDEHSPAKRIMPTKRSEQLYSGPNLLQIQSTAVAPKSHDGFIDSIGLGVLNLAEVITDWQSSGGVVVKRTDNTAWLQDPWGVHFELIERSVAGYTHINIAVKTPEQLCDWYQSNLGGKRVICEWNKNSLALEYDTMLLVFIPMSSSLFPTVERLLDHMGWYTKDLDAIYKYLSSNGVKFPVPPRTFGPVRLAFLEDPCGCWIELVEPPNGIISKPK
jgi:catechol 2,3-dioxygenase-like lactoylglutathione lyase family enzyme